MIPISPSSGDVERQVDLGRRERLQPSSATASGSAPSSASTASRPTSSLRRIRSGVGFGIRIFGINERQRALPLELCLQLASDRPVNITQMIIHHWVHSHQLRGAFHGLDRFVIAAQPVKNPPQRVDYMA